MRTNIEIDDALMREAMRASGAKTKKAAVEEGLKLLVRLGEQVKAVQAMRGMGWDGDLDAMREGRRSDPE